MSNHHCLYCLICNSTISSTDTVSTSGGGQLNYRGNVKDSVPFLIRILLGIPKKIVEDNELISKVEWFVTCEKCWEGVEEAKKIYGQLLEVLRRFRTVQESIVHTLKIGSGKVDSSKKKRSRRRRGGDGGTNGDGELDLRGKCRQFVSKRRSDWNSGSFVTEKLTQDLPDCSSLAEGKVKEEISDEDANDLLAMELEDLSPPGHHFSSLHSETDEESKSSGQLETIIRNNLDGEDTVQEAIQDRELPEDMHDVQVKEEVDSENESEDNADIEGASASHSVKGDKGQVLEFQEDSSGGYNCITCGANLKQWQSLKYHARAIHKVELNNQNHPKYPCPKNGCRYVLKTKTSFDKHMATHRKPRTNCRICGLEFYSDGLMRQHIREAHKKLALPPSIKVPEEPKSECPVCHNLYKTVISLRKHIISAHPNENIRVEPHKLPCPWEGCDKVYTNSNTLQTHLALHQGEARFKCDICEKSFYQYNSMTRHKEREHDTGNAKVCDICGFISQTQDSFVQHRINKHKIQPKKYNVRKKVRKETVTEDGKFKCDLCGKLFSLASSLSTHIKCDHEGRIPFICEYCSKGFRSRLQLKHHQIMKHRVGDVSELPPYRPFDFQCPVKGCKKQFRGPKERLENHMAKEHDGGTQYKYHCKYCGKGFAIMHKLRTHEMGHENKDTKPFKCGVCGNTFSTPAYLRVHELTRHNAPRKIVNRRKLQKGSEKQMS